MRMHSTEGFGEGRLDLGAVSTEASDQALVEFGSGDPGLRSSGVVRIELRPIGLDRCDLAIDVGLFQRNEASRVEWFVRWIEPKLSWTMRGMCSGMRVPNPAEIPTCLRELPSGCVVRVIVFEPRGEQQLRSGLSDRVDDRFAMGRNVLDLPVWDLEHSDEVCSEHRCRGSRFFESDLRRASRTRFAAAQVEQTDPATESNDPCQSSAREDLDVIGMCTDRKHVEIHDSRFRVVD